MSSIRAAALRLPLARLAPRPLRFGWALGTAFLLSTLSPFPTGPGPGSLSAQEVVRIEGTITDEATTNPVRGAQVRLVETEGTDVTGRSGRFRLSVPGPGSYTLLIEAMGYRSLERRVDVGPEGLQVEVTLERGALPLPEVVATGTPLRGVAPYQPGQAFGREELSVRMGNSFGEMLDGEPGLAMRSFGPAPGRPVIRGLDGDRVAVLENGQRMGDMAETAHDHGIAMEPLTADRVEVVRGPASLLYGSSALGGVVNLLRRDIPTDWRPGLSGEGAAQLASVNRLVAGALTGEYGGDGWAATGRASLRTSGDVRAPGSPTGVLESTHNRLATAGAGVGWRGEALRGGVALDLHDQIFGVPEELDDLDEEIEIRSRRERLTGRLEWRRDERFFQDLELRFAAARYGQREAEMERAPDGSVEEEIPHDFTRRTLDATLTATHGRLGPFAEGAVGATVLVQTLAARGIEEFHPDGRRLAVAAFAFERLPLTDRIALQAGLRLEQGRTEASENEMFPDFSARRDATTLSGALGIGVRPTTNLEVGAQVAQAHRTPLLEQLYSDGPHIGAARFEIGAPELRNEVGHGFDAYARYAGPRLRGEVALFHNTIDHFVFPRRTGETDAPSGLPVVEWSAAAAAFTGGEAALEVLLTPSLRVRTTGDYVRGVQRDEARTPLPFVPPARASLGLTYDPGPWWAGARARAAARQDRVPPGLEPTSGYGLLDLQAGARFGDGGGHSLVLRMENALDKIYRDHLSRVDDRRFPMPGRNVSVVYRRSF